METETPMRFPLVALFVVAAAIALACSAWVSADQESRMRKLKAEIQTRSQKTNVYILRCLLNDNLVGKNIADLPDIPALANWTFKSDDCQLQHNRLLVPNELEIGKDNSAILRKGEFVDSQFETRADDRMYVFIQSSPTVKDEGFQASGVGFYVRNEKIWAIFECGSFLPE